MHTVTPAPTRSDAALLEQIRYQGAYATVEQAERVTAAVLDALGQQIVGDERVELARQLPPQAARHFSQALPGQRPLTAHAFVKALAEATHAPYTITRWHVGSVLGALARTVDKELLHRVLAQLPSGYALLFGQADLTVGARRLPVDQVVRAA
ncbi:DUF2267 domain-containing protein [Streptomyces kunmingensis]|uniref:DUF2267 domain-containing protein n=1 Tax=Streptomyces kunmingensis TaxID=68225 RepID=A0ABU6C5P4_9ACTN|nr:DUF2267 domain-containing protein [Streptomyces kunmingensis]MEB3959937.1 DUF2267 domain-containing protein [Streptomyces kunmingensis]